MSFRQLQKALAAGAWNCWMLFPAKLVQVCRSRVILREYEAHYPANVCCFGFGLTAAEGARNFQILCERLANMLKNVGTQPSDKVPAGLVRPVIGQQPLTNAARESSTNTHTHTHKLIRPSQRRKPAIPRCRRVVWMGVKQQLGRSTRAPCILSNRSKGRSSNSGSALHKLIM